MIAYNFSGLFAHDLTVNKMHPKIHKKIGEK